MTARSRRQVLRATAGAIGVLAAGCTGERRPRRDDTPETERPRWDEDDIITDVDVSVHRIQREIPRGERVLTYEEADDSPGRDRRRWPYVIDEDDVDALTFRVEPSDVEAAWEFLRETDYGESTVVIAQRGVGACHRYELQYVERRGGGDRLAPQVCRVKRDPSVECSIDDRHTQLTLVRVPLAFDRPPRGHGSGGSSSCRLPPDHPAHAGGGDG